MKIKIKVIGSGTQAELSEALKDLANQFDGLTETEFLQGGDLENDHLTCEFDQIN